MANLRSVFNRFMRGRGGAYQSGAWISPIGVPSGTFIYQNAVAYFLPVFNGWTAKAQAIATEVTVAGTAGSVVRLGLYSDSGFNWPQKLLVDAGTIDGTIVAVPSLPINVTVPAGLTWLCVSPQGAPATGATQRVWGNPVFQKMHTTAALAMSSQVFAYFANPVVGALPALLTWAGISPTTSAPMAAFQYL